MVSHILSTWIVERRGDQRFDWTRAWIEDWKATNWPEGPDDSLDDALARYEAYRPELERAIVAGAPSGEYFYVEAIETSSPDAVSLPRDIFDGERDRRWIFNRPLGQWELLNRTCASP